jgi:hypothetical protein
MRVPNPLLPFCFAPFTSRGLSGLRAGDGQCDCIVDDYPVCGRGLQHVAHGFFMGAGGDSALGYGVRSIAQSYGIGVGWRHGVPPFSNGAADGLAMRQPDLK